LIRLSLASVIDITPCHLGEIPKDLLDFVSVKKLFRVLNESDKSVAFAGTTDFARLAGLSWRDYQRYVDIQTAVARFLHCKYLRFFLQANTSDELQISLPRVTEYGRRHTDMETVIETHGGFESSKEGFEFCLHNSSTRFVVDFANIRDGTLKELIVNGDFGEQIAYFHLRNLPSELLPGNRTVT